MNFLERAWYNDAAWLGALAPLSRLFGHLAQRRRAAYRSGRRKVQELPVPVVVVGNISVGGTGKTPLVAWLADRLREAGYQPGIISRGYGARPATSPYRVSRDSPVDEAGDEALLLARRGHPVVIAPERVVAARALLAGQPHCDLILSDDGLQHYALGRDLEIAVIDGERRFGNGRLLPAGPLREPPARLAEVDFVICQGGDASCWPDALSMQLEPRALVNIKSGEHRSLSGGAPGQGARVHAVAGIGHPQRFFNSLKSLGFAIIAHEFPDHHPYRARDLAFGDELDIIMTEKDAVKCASFATANHWYLNVEAILPAGFLPALLNRLTPEDSTWKR